MTLVKICGITEVEHAEAALEAGADMLGFVFAPSRRQIATDAATEIIQRCRDSYSPDERRWSAVGVFTDQPFSFVEDTAASCGLDVVQLSSGESVDASLSIGMPIFKAVHLSGLHPSVNPANLAESLAETLRELRVLHPASRLLLDSGGPGVWGGTGQTFDWRSIGQAARDFVVAGGLNPSNVGTAIAAMHPWAVDVSSGVESGGRKDPELIRRFIAAVRRTDNHEQ